MHPVLEGLPGLLSRLVLFGPVIYLGLHILLNPDWLAGVLDSALDGIQRFPDELRGLTRLPVAREPRPVLHTSASLSYLRWTGLVLAAYGVLGLSGLGRP